MQCKIKKKKREKCFNNEQKSNKTEISKNSIKTEIFYYKVPTRLMILRYSDRK